MLILAQENLDLTRVILEHWVFFRIQGTCHACQRRREQEANRDCILFSTRLNTFGKLSHLILSSPASIMYVLTNNALLVKVQWSLVGLGQLAIGFEFLVHELADGAVRAVGADDQMAHVGGLVHAGHHHLRGTFCDIDHSLASGQLLRRDFGQQKLVEIRPEFFLDSKMTNDNRIRLNQKENRRL